MKRAGIVLGMAMVVSCGSEAPPPGSEEGSSTEVVADGDSSGRTSDSTSDSTAEPPGSTGGSTDDGASEASSSTGETFEECLPRAFESNGAWQLVAPAERFGFEPYTTQSQCTFVQEVAPVEPGTRELELACEPTDPPLPAQLFLRLWAELEALPFAPGDPLRLAVILEPPGTINQQLLVTLRDPEGELLVAGFWGYQPMGKGPESATFFEPVTLALVDGLCPVPCEDFGCFTRAALDVSIATETARIFDGNAATLGASPSYRVHVGYANTGSSGLDDPGVHVNVVVGRQP